MGAVGGGTLWLTRRDVFKWRRHEMVQRVAAVFNSAEDKTFDTDRYMRGEGVDKHVTST